MFSVSIVSEEVAGRTKKGCHFPPFICLQNGFFDLFSKNNAKSNHSATLGHLNYIYLIIGRTGSFLRISNSLFGRFRQVEFASNTSFFRLKFSKPAKLSSLFYLLLYKKQSPIATLSPHSVGSIGLKTLVPVCAALWLVHSHTQLPSLPHSNSNSNSTPASCPPKVHHAVTKIFEEERQGR